MASRSYPSAIAWHAQQSPERSAVVHDDHRVSFAELDARSNRLARAYAAMGVAPSFQVASAAVKNSIEFGSAIVTRSPAATPIAA
jgi:bile acid-coenzyme A ligase